MENLYKHDKIKRMTKRAKIIVSELFNFYITNPQNLPQEYQLLEGKFDAKKLAISVSDYIAGMTDRFAIKQHKELTKKDNGNDLTTFLK